MVRRRAASKITRAAHSRLSSAFGRERVDTLEVIDCQAEIRLMNRYIDAMNRPLAILDVGWGRKWPLRLSVPYRLTGIDTDAEAMVLRKQSRSDLTTAIVGDLGTSQLPASSFDVIYRSYVLEHVQGANRVLAKFLDWLKPGGLMIIRMSDRDAVYGWSTRHSPIWLHDLYKHWIGGFKNAGKPGFDSYPVFNEEIVSRIGMVRFCRAPNLEHCETRRVCTYPTKCRLPRVGASATCYPLADCRGATTTFCTSSARPREHRRRSTRGQMRLANPHITHCSLKTEGRSLTETQDHWDICCQRSRRNRVSAN